MKHIFISILSFFVISSAQATIDLSCNVEQDFADYNCIEDTTGDASTGFDIDQVCFYYDGSADDLYVGVSANGNIFFGDANGDDADVSAGADVADLGVGESFVISFDLNADSADSDFNDDTVDVLVGVDRTHAFAGLGVYEVGNGYNPFDPSGDFGVETDQTITLVNKPSPSCDDLEFIVHDFKAIEAHDVTTVAQNVYLKVFAEGKTGYGNSDDSVPDNTEIATALSHAIFDFDADGIEDWDELDNYGTEPNSSDTDGDGIVDGVEVGVGIEGANPTNPAVADTDLDNCSDGYEDDNFNGIFEPLLGESNPNVFDTDSDGLGDCIEQTGNNPTDPNDSDSDNDGLLDGTEDANHNGVFEPEICGVNGCETDPNNPDTDFGGVNDGDEVLNGFNPNDPLDDDAAEAAIGSGNTGFNQVQGGGVNCALNVGAPFSGWELLMGFLSLLILICLRIGAFKNGPDARLPVNTQPERI